MKQQEMVIKIIAWSQQNPLKDGDKVAFDTGMQRNNGAC